MTRNRKRKLHNQQMSRRRQQHQQELTYDMQLSLSLNQEESSDQIQESQTISALISKDRPLSTGWKQPECDEQTLVQKELVSEKQDPSQSDQQSRSCPEYPVTHWTRILFP